MKAWVRWMDAVVFVCVCVFSTSRGHTRGRPRRVILFLCVENEMKLTLIRERRCDGYNRLYKL